MKEIETSIVPQEQWSRFADAYDNFYEKIL